MKNLFLIILTSLLLFSCKDRDEPANPVEQLPPATTVGANTIGCLVNGEVFLPRQNNPTGPSPTNCYYQFLDNGYHFNMSLSNDRGEYLRGVSIGTDNIELNQGNTYTLNLNNGYTGISKYGEFTKYTGGINGIKTFSTNSINKGELKILKLDKINYIISGTFWFNGELNGEIIKITEGRFDMHYTP